MRKKLFFVFFIAFILRILLINVAFHGDLYNNLSWGNMAIKGLNGFYEKTGFQYSIPNQPPLYIILFALTSFLYQTIYNFSWYLNSHFGFFPSAFIWFWQQSGNIILLKLPGIFADLGIGYMIYHIFKSKNKQNLGFNLAALWLFNPITFYNSAIWGQTDTIVNLLGLMSVYFLINKKLVKSLLFLTLSLLFKGSLAIFVPILFFFALWQKYELKTWMKAILISGIATILITVWFHPNLNLPVWLLNLYTKQILPGEIGDLSANAFNFWYLINPGKVLDSIKYFGVTAHFIGYITTLSVMAVAIFKLQKQKTENRLLFSLAIVAMTSFLFMTRIHERYLYPFFPVATILVGFKKKFLIPYLILSFTFLLNMYNLFWAPGIFVFENILKTSGLPNILTVINLVVFVYVFIWFIIRKERI